MEHSCQSSDYVASQHVVQPIIVDNSVISKESVLEMAKSMDLQVIKQLCVDNKQLETLFSDISVLRLLAEINGLNGLHVLPVIESIDQLIMYRAYYERQRLLNGMRY